MDAFEGVAQAVFAYVADLQLVIAVWQLYGMVCRVGNGAVFILVDPESSRQNLYRLIVVNIYPQAHHTEKVVNIKAANAYLICSAEAETHSIFHRVRFVRGH